MARECDKRLKVMAFPIEKQTRPLLIDNEGRLRSMACTYLRCPTVRLSQSYIAAYLAKEMQCGYNIVTLQLFQLLP